MNEEELKELIRKILSEIFFVEEFSPLNVLMKKIDEFLYLYHQESQIERNERICEKFESYMQNIGRLNVLVNEFKGLVSVIRSEAVVVKDQNRIAKRNLKKLLEILSEEL